MNHKEPFLNQCGKMLATVLFFSCGLLAEEISITGSVHTKLGDPAPDLLIRLAGTSHTTTTDEFGEFRLEESSTGIRGKIRMQNTHPPSVAPYTILTTAGSRPQSHTTMSLLGRSLRNAPTSLSPAMSVSLKLPESKSQSIHPPARSIIPAATHTLQVCKGEAVLAEVALEDLTADVGTVTLETGIPHPMLVASYSKKRAYIINELNEVIWEYRMPGSCQDAWMLGDSTILLSGGNCVRIVDRDKEVLWEYKNESTEIHNCQPLPNGGVLFGVNATGMVYELSADSTVLKELDLSFISGNSHGRFRIIRKCGDRYVVCAKDENTIYIVDAEGTVERKITKEDMQEKGVEWNALHAAILLPNGNLLVGGGYNSTVCEIDESGDVVWNMTADDVPSIGLKYAAGFHRLPNGNTLISAYNSSNYKIFEVTPDKEIAWSMDNDDMGKPTHVYALDCPGDPVLGEVLR